MVVIQANRLHLAADVNYGEGYIAFEWPEPLYGREWLQIDMEGFCSRMMPFRSGQGPPEFLDVDPEFIRLRFDQRLALRLELAPEIEIRFQASADEFRQLLQAVTYLRQGQ